MKKDLFSIKMKCHHCHQTTYMEDHGSGVRDIPINPEFPFQPPEETWTLLICPNCDNENIVHGVYEDGEVLIEPKTVYPPAVTYTAPKDIDLQFRASIGVTHANPNAAVNQFRVVLEMIWEDQMPVGTEKKPIRGNPSMISQLLDRNVLSGNYADMADMLVWIGHSGSHSEDDVTIKDAEMARELCQAILEHVYRIRPKGLELVEKLEKRFPRKAKGGWRDGEFVNKDDW